MPESGETLQPAGSITVALRKLEAREGRARLTWFRS